MLVIRELEVEGDVIDLESLLEVLLVAVELFFRVGLFGSHFPVLERLLLGADMDGSDLESYLGDFFEGIQGILRS